MGKFHNLVFYQSGKKVENGSAQVIEKSISAEYSEMGYSILRVFDANVIKKWQILVKLPEIHAWPVIELKKTSVKMLLLVFSEPAHVIF